MATGSRWTSREPTAGAGAHERAPGRHRVRHLPGDEDDGRPGRSRPPELGLLAADRARGRAGHGGERAFPAPVVYANHEISHRVCDMLFGALAALAPDRVMACSQGTSAILTLGRRRRSHGRALRELRDGQGRLRRAAHQGRHQRGGERHLEHDEHARRDPRDELPRARRALRDRGRQWRPRPLSRRLRRASACGACSAQPSQASVCCERTKSPPFGLAGGGAGAPARVAVVGPGRRRARAEQQGLVHVAPGRGYRLRAPGAGGYGPPAARDRARLRDDVVNGYVSRDAALSEYGYTEAADLACAACRPVHSWWPDDAGNTGRADQVIANGSPSSNADRRSPRTGSGS